MNLRSVCTVAAFELRRQFGSWVTIVLFAFLMFQTAIYAMNPEYVAKIGAAGLPRNSAYVVYMFTSDNGFWLLFFLAYVMTVPITRDREHLFAGVAHALPGGLRGYILGKYLGAIVSAAVIAAAIPISWMVVPFVARTLGAQGLGPILWRQIAHAYVLFLLPSVLGLGSLYFATAVRTSRAATAFVLSFLLTVLWMVSILVLFRDEVHRTAAEWIDPIGYNSVLAQLSYWTTEERLDGFMRLDGPFLVNRVAVCASGTLALLAVMIRPSTAWLLGTARHPAGTPVRSRVVSSSERPSQLSSRPIRRIDAMAHVQAVLTGGLGLLGESLRSGMTRGVMAFGALVMLASIFFELDDGVLGPLRPWIGLISLRAVEFWYMPTALFLCFSAGRWVTRERDANLWQIFDALPAPTWVLAATKLVALVGLSLVMAMVPVVSDLALQLVMDRATFSPTGSLFFALCVSFPTNVEISFLALTVYVLVTHRGIAHFLSYILVFLCVMNHTMDIVTPSMLQFAIPIHVNPSPLTGLEPWLRPALWINLWFLSVASFLALVATSFWPRGVDLGAYARARTALRSVARGAWVPAVVVILVGVLSGVRTFRAIHVENDFRTPGTLRAEAAAYERKYAPLAREIRVRPVSGELDLVLHTDERSAEVRYSVLVECPDAICHVLDLDWPERFSVTSLALDDRVPSQIDTSLRLRHRRITVDPPLAQGSRLRLRVAGIVSFPSFANEGRVPRITPDGAWLRDEDILPRLGYDASRELRGIGQRQEQGLGARSSLDPRDERDSAYGRDVDGIPLSLIVRAPAGMTLVVSGSPTTEGEVRGDLPARSRLAIAVARYNRATVDRVEVLHASERREVARAMGEAGARSLDALGERYGKFTAGALRIVECPRGLEGSELFGDVMMIPEDRGWDSTSSNPAITFEVARLLSRHWWVDRLDPARAEGWSTLGDGLSMMTALVAVEAILGPDVRSAMGDRMGDRALRAIADAREPIVPLGQSREGSYVALYGGVRLFRLRAETGAEPFDGMLRQLLDHGRTTLAGFLRTTGIDRLRDPGSPFENIEAVSMRALGARAERSPDGSFHTTIDLTFRPYRYQGLGWREVRLPYAVELSLLDADGHEMTRAPVMLGTGERIVTVSSDRRPTTVVLDPDQRFVDRNQMQDRAALRRVRVE